MLRSMGLVDIPPEEYPILLETLDKNKDGKICFNDFVSQIPTFDINKVFVENDDSKSPRKRESSKLKGFKRNKIPGLSGSSNPELGVKSTKLSHKFKYDKNDKSDVIILDDEDYERIIEDYKEKISSAV